MSEEKIKLTAIIRTDIRNPFSNIVFNPILGAEYGRDLYSEGFFTKDSILRMFRNIRQSRFMRISILSDEIEVVHSLQGLFNSKATISEIEIIAEDGSKPWFNIAPNQSNALLATLKMPRVQIRTLIPTKSDEGNLVYYYEFKLGGGSSLVAY